MWIKSVPDRGPQQQHWRINRILSRLGLSTASTKPWPRCKNCDMILVSATLPSGGALELVRAVMNLDPWVRVLVTNLAESQEASAPYIEAGATGWVM